MTQLHDLTDIIDLDIKSIQELVDTAYRPGHVRDWLEIEKRAIQEKNIPSLTAWLLHEHQFNGKSTIQLAKELGITNSVVRNIMNNTGIPKRDFKEGAKNRQVKNSGKTPDQEILRKIGETALSHGFNVVRTTLVRAIGGDRFYSTYAHGEEGMHNLVEQIRALDMKRFGHLQYIPIRRRKTSRKHLSAEETTIFEKALLELAETKKSGNGRVPEGTLKVIEEKLLTEGYNRTTPSISYHAHKIWTGHQYKYGPDNLPTHILKAKDRVIRQLEERLTEVDELPGNKGELEEIIEPDKTGKRRKDFLEEATREHQMLVAYLIDPVNYKKYLGQDTKLVAADFTKDNTDPETFEHYKDRLSALKELAPEDREVVAFAHFWQKCDLVFLREDGSHLVVEVKPNAKDGERWKNATKSRQQLASYTSVISDNLRKKNFTNRTTQNYNPLNELVDGMIASYEIDDWLQDYLAAQPRRGFVKIQRDEVMRYTMPPAVESPEQTSGKIPTRKRRKAKTSSTPSSVPELELPFVETAPPTIREEKHVETKPARNGGQQQEYETRERHFGVLYSELSALPPHLEVARYDPKTRVIEYGGRVYELNGSASHIKAIENLVKKDIVTRGHINLMKYKGQAPIGV